jgi:hypothetical protein
MVKRKIVSFILFFLPALLLWAEGGKSQIELADPYILLDGDKYYAYGTRDDNGIRCYSSDDLRSWKYEGLALHKDNTTESIFFWAPEVYHLGDKYYMYYSANQRLFVATGNSPKGPFKQVGGYQMQNLLGDENCIDSHVFFDDDGSVWMFFVRFNDNICIWQCRLADDYITPVEGTLRKCIAGSQAWEQKEGRVNEGPNVIKYKNTYYLTYSGNGYESQNYAVGYATTRNISKGAWTKYENNPILCRRDELVGTGHHSIFTDKEGNMRIVFHAHNSTESVHHRLMYIGTMQFSGTRLTMSNDPIIRPTLTDNPYNPELIDKTRAFQQGAATTVDLNNDGYQDIVVGGMNEGKRLTYVSKYLSATHRWSTNTSIPFQVANMPSLLPCDLNNDGNMDIVAFEQNGSDADDNSRQGIFLGKGDGTFTEAPLVFTNPDGSLCPFDVKGPSSADIIDIDNDGRLDIICAGHQGEVNYNVVLHQQGIDEEGIHFTVEPYENDFLFSNAVIQAADMNNDGYQDFVISAQVDGMEDRSCFTDVYLNDTLSHGHFIRLGLGENEGVIKRKANGALLVADFTNDGWTDIFMSGEGDQSSGETAIRQRMYANQQTATPTFATVSSDVTSARYIVQTSVNNSAGVIDWDGDGSYDLLIGGRKTGSKNCEGHLFLNSIGSRTGRLSKYCTIPGATYPSIIFPDWDGDGRKDYYVNGFCNDDNYLTDVQRGIASVMCYNLYPTPKRPEAPLNPTATVQDGGILLQWEVPESVQPNCTYEIFITDSLGNQLNSTPAFVGGTNDGVRKVNRMGRIGSTKQWTFHPTASGTYLWGVQTVNAAYNGSTFTTGPAFTVSSVPTGIHSYAGLDIAQPSGIYSPEGIRRAEPQRGINILRTKEGIRKVVISN